MQMLPGQRGMSVDRNVGEAMPTNAMQFNIADYDFFFFVRFTFTM